MSYQYALFTGSSQKPDQVHSLRNHMQLHFEALLALLKKDVRISDHPDLGFQDI